MSDGWHPGSGPIPDRTDRVIEALLDQEFDEFGISTLDEAIRRVADVHSERTVKQYRRRVIEYGPFERSHRGVARYEIANRRCIEA